MKIHTGVIVVAISDISLTHAAWWQINDISAYHIIFLTVNIIRHFSVDQKGKLVKLDLMTFNVFLRSVIVVPIVKNIFYHSYTSSKT